jgi:hypothetical protein
MVDLDDQKIGLILLLLRLSVYIDCSEIERHLRIVGNLYDELSEKKKDVVDDLLSYDNFGEEETNEDYV